MAVRVNNSAAIEAAEAELRAAYAVTTPIEASAIKLAARLVARIDEHRAGDDPIRLSEALGRVTALLPPPREAPPIDLALLTDEQLRTLHEIVAIGTGQQPPEPQPEPVEPELSPRHFAAVDLAAKLDQIEQRGGFVESERPVVAGMFAGLLPLCCGTMSQMFQKYWAAPSAAAG